MKQSIIKISLLLLIPLLVMSCSTGKAQQQPVQKIDNEELKKLLNEGVQLLDVRTPEEVSYGIIKGAVVVDFYDPSFTDKITSQLDTTQPVAVYCAAGGRSAKTTERLLELGFTQIYDLSRGYRGWKAEGNPVKTND